jgi:hypothetical protein
MGQPLLQATVGMSFGQIGDQSGGRSEQDGIALPDRRAAQGHRQMGFIAAIKMPS